MILHTEFDGGADPFEGARDLVLRGLPADARVLAARATIAAVDPSGGRDPFAEEIRFPATSSGPGATGDWGATQVRGAGFVEIDFHARRTLAGIAGSGLEGGDRRLLVDLGGNFVAVDPNGGFAPASGPFLSLTNNGPLPGIAASRIRISSSPPVGNPAVASVRVRSLPTNVTFGLEGRPALFFQAGELAGERATVEFGELLGIYLAESGRIENGAYSLPFVLRSDSIARLRVSIDIEYLRITSILPPGLPEAKLAYDLATAPRAGSAALEVSLPAAAVPVAAESGGKVVGPFAETRIAWGPIGATTGSTADETEATIPIGPTQSAAQPLALPDRPEGYQIAAVDLQLAALDSKVKLTLDLRADDSGKPGPDSLLSAPVPFERSRMGDGGNVWFSVELPRPLTLRNAADRRAWVLLQSAEGEAAWSVVPAAPANPPAVPLQASEDGGFSYRACFDEKTGAPLAVQLRLRERPAGFRMPLSAQVGEGGNAVRVDLSRLSPLGKVAFDLSIPEISAGISAALAKVRSTGAANGGELLADPAFARWGTEGDEIGSPRPIALGAAAAAPLIAFAPNGRIAFGVVVSSNLRVHLVAWDTEILAEAWSLELSSGPNTTAVDVPLGLAVDPAGRFVFLLRRAGVAVVDLATQRPLGAIALAEGPFAPDVLALSNDGAQLAIGGSADGATESGPKIALFDAEGLVDQIRAGAPVGTRLRTIDAEEEAIALAFSADGARLYVLTREPEPVGATASTGPTGRLSAYDVPFTGQSIHVLFDGLARKLAPTSDGSAVLVLHPNRLDRYDADTLAIAEPGLELPGQGFSALAIEPGGARALLVGASGLFAVGLASGALRRLPVPAGFGIHGAIAVSPLGDRAAAVPLSETGAALNRPVQVIPLGTTHPLDWTLTAGLARPFSLSGAAGRGLFLGEPESAKLSTQPTASATAPGPSALSQVAAAVPGRTYEMSFLGWAQGEARAEVLWRATSGATLRIEFLPLAARSRGISPGPTLHRGRFTAPPETIAAEVRFVVEEGQALLRDASFREPDNALAAGDLRGAFATVWTKQPAAAPGFRIAAAGSGSRVSNAGAGSVTLRQQVVATSGAPFELRVRARLEAGASPRLGLRFLAADGAEVGDAVGIEMANHGFDQTLALGTVPANAARAEVAFAIPAGSSVRIDAIELQLVPHVRVPLVFLAEAPGELSVVGGTIAWDLADSNAPNPTVPGPRPHPTPTPLPPPTPPPGAQGEDDCGCGDDQPAPPPQLSRAPQQVRAEPIEIKGIGPRRAEILRTRGVTTAAALLAADPRELARMLPGVSEKMAVEFIRQARVLAG